MIFFLTVAAVVVSTFLSNHLIGFGKAICHFIYAFDERSKDESCFGRETLRQLSSTNDGILCADGDTDAASRIDKHKIACKRYQREENVVLLHSPERRFLFFFLFRFVERRANGIYRFLSLFLRFPSSTFLPFIFTCFVFFFRFIQMNSSRCICKVRAVAPLKNAAIK